MSQNDSDPRHHASDGGVQVGGDSAVPSRKRRFAGGLLRASSFVLLLVLFGAADVLRTSAVRTATLLSMGGWLAFGVLVLAWAWKGMDAATALRQVGRIATLTLVSFGVLYAYYVRSRMIETGPHTDAVFTYLGLQSFVELQNPITFAGRTPSFPQAPLMLLLHLPGVAIGFAALGPMAIPFGAIVHLALLLGVITDYLVDGSLLAKGAVVALVSGLYSNRMLLLTYDITGYAFPAICLGLMFLVLVDERVDDPSRAVGGLLAVALLHHYPGFFMVLPLCIAWLVCGRKPWQRMRRFLTDNPVVIAVVLMLTITMVTNPELLLTRVTDVAVGPHGVDRLRDKLRENVMSLTVMVPVLRYQFFTSTRGSWFLLSVPPLAGFLVPLVAGAWVVSVATAERPRRYLLLLLGLAVALAALTVLQNLLTDFSDYRSFPFLFAMFTTALAFLFRLPQLRWKWRALATAYAIAFAIYNYVDLGRLHGATHAVETAYRSQATMDGLRQFVDEPDAVRQLGAAKVFVVVDPFFPLEPLYLGVVKPKAGVPVETIQAAEVCPRGRMWIDELSRRSCESFLVVANVKHCESAALGSAADGRPRIRGYLFEATCDRPFDEPIDRAVVDVDIDGGRRSSGTCSHAALGAS
jgi:hypothetical protein